MTHSRHRFFWDRPFRAGGHEHLFDLFSVSISLSASSSVADNYASDQMNGTVFGTTLCTPPSIDWLCSIESKLGRGQMAQHSIPSGAQCSTFLHPSLVVFSPRCIKEDTVLCFPLRTDCQLLTLRVSLCALARSWLHHHQQITQLFPYKSRIHGVSLYL